MWPRLQKIEEFSPSQSPSLWLPAAACMVIIIFAASLAQARPTDDLLVLAKSDVSGDVGPLQTPRRLVTDDSVSENEEQVLSAPLPAPMYHDRYRFYHRYDNYRAPLRFGPLDDGLD